MAVFPSLEEQWSKCLMKSAVLLPQHWSPCFWRVTIYTGKQHSGIIYYIHSILHMFHICVFVCVCVLACTHVPSGVYIVTAFWSSTMNTFRLWFCLLFISHWLDLNITKMPRIVPQMQLLLSFIKWLSAITSDSSLTSHGSGHELNVKQTTHLTFKLADVVKTVVGLHARVCRLINFS